MFLALAVFLLPVIVGEEFAFPDHQIEIESPKGFKVSIPDVDGTTLFAVHFNINKEIEFLEAGHISVDVVRKKGGRWVYCNKNISIKKGDKLYYWLYMIIDGRGYRLDNQKYFVTDVPFTSTISSTDEPPISVTSDAPSTTPAVNLNGKNCTKSVSEFDVTPPCSGQIMFFDDFSSDLDDNWFHHVRFSDSSEADFTIWTKHAGTSGISGGQLYIQPRLLDSLNGSIVRDGSFQLSGCTSRNKKDCQRTAYSWSILPPIMSSRLSTKNSFSFLYGDVEIRAKLPLGDWIVPEIWLEPVEVSYGVKSGRIFLGKALGNPSLKDSNNFEIGANLLQQGYFLDAEKGRHFHKINDNSLWSSDFHVYKLRWAPDSLTFFVDGEQIGHVKASDSNPLNPDLEGTDGSPLAPFDREFYLNIGVHVGGNDDFPDGSVSGGKAKPWENMKVKNVLNFWQHKDEWYPTWKFPNQRLAVDYVKVTAL